jgi:hypothetical protein
MKSMTKIDEKYTTKHLLKVTAMPKLNYKDMKTEQARVPDP